MTDKKKLFLYVFIVLSLSLLLWGSLILLKFEVPNLEGGSSAKAVPTLFFILNGFMPSIVGLVLYGDTVNLGGRASLRVTSYAAD